MQTLTITRRCVSRNTTVLLTGVLLLSRPVLRPLLTCVSKESSLLPMLLTACLQCDGQSGYGGHNECHDDGHCDGHDCHDHHGHHSHESHHDDGDHHDHAIHDHRDNHNDHDDQS